MIKFLIKGLLRDKSRSLFPALTVSAGVFLAVFLYSFMNGFLSDIINSTAQFDTGYVKIVTAAYKKYSSQMPNDLAILSADKLLANLRQSYPGMVWTPRIRFGGLLDFPDRHGETRSQGPVIGIGINLLSAASPAKKILDLEKSVVSGRMPAGKNEILVSELLAKKLGARVGDTATLISSTMYGSMAMHNFKVAGIIRFGMLALDKSTIIADIGGARDALDMAGASSEILGFSKDMLYSESAMMKLAEDFNGKFYSVKDEFSPVMATLGQQGFGDYLQLMEYFSVIIVGLFVFAMAIVLWNSGLLNSLRRYGEIGIRLAMGEPKGAIYRSMIMESVAIGIIGSVAGTALGVAVSFYFQYYGFDISKMMPKSGLIMSNVLRAKVMPLSYVIGLFPGIVASVLGTAFAGIGIYRRQTAQLFKELEV